MEEESLNFESECLTGIQVYNSCSVRILEANYTFNPQLPIIYKGSNNFVDTWMFFFLIVVHIFPVVCLSTFLKMKNNYEKKMVAAQD